MPENECFLLGFDHRTPLEQGVCEKREHFNTGLKDRIPLSKRTLMEVKAFVQVKINLNF